MIDNVQVAVFPGGARQHASLALHSADGRGRVEEVGGAAQLREGDGEGDAAPGAVNTSQMRELIGCDSPIDPRGNPSFT